MSGLRHSIYRALYPIFFLLVMFFGYPLSSKIREGFRLRRERLKPSNIPKLDRCYWIHAASGEYEYARPLIQRLKTKYPDIPIVVTFFSPSYVKTLDKDPLVDYALPLPFDFPGAVSSFIDSIHPKMLLVARTDLWAEVLYQCHKRHINTVLFSYYQNPERSRISFIFRKWLLNQLNHVDCVNEETAQKLIKLKKPSLSSYGDTRFDRVIERMENPKPLNFTIPQDKVITFGSTWSEDERICFPALRKSRTHWDLAIVAPHEPTPSRIKEIKAHLNQLRLSFELFSQLKGKPTKDVLIVDRVGVLFDLYKFSSLSFVGGSFKKSVHSVMEPLAQGSKVMLGPKILNNAEAVEFQNLMFHELKPLELVKDAIEMTRVIESHFELSTLERNHFSEWIGEEALKRAGASDKLIQRLF